jgi:nicotinamide riboside kinase
LPWEYDPLREHPDQRKFLFDLYQKELESYGFNYKVVSGKDESRFKNALGFVKEIFSDDGAKE